MSRVLQAIADDVGASERTLRRALNEGLLRGDRPSTHKLAVPLSERRYIASHWTVLSRLRALLRTEPSVECAVLFGSVARGDDSANSDVDLLVWMREPSPGLRRAVSRRLSDGLGRHVQIVDFEDARRDSSLLESVLRDGRALVDRGGRWPALRATETTIHRRAERERRLLAERATEARRYFAERSSGAS